MSNVYVDAPAKVNLALYVLGRRGDGYHEVWTLMQTICSYESHELADQLRLTTSTDGRVELTVSGRSVPTGEENLVVRAANLLRDRHEVEAGVKIHLEKAIPVGAGLGGGSSDAAAVLVGLSELWGLELAQEELLTLAADLGSDVPFFIVGGTAICRGRGELVEPLEVAGTLWYVVVAPGEGVSTESAYGRLKASISLTKVPDDAKKIEEAVRPGRAEDVRHLCHNDLETAALELSPACARVREVMLVAGLPQATVSGSGSALFCVCSSREEAQQYAGRLREQQEEVRAEVFVAEAVKRAGRRSSARNDSE